MTIGAEVVELHEFEKREIFEGCMPVEVMAKRGKDTLRFGPLKPVGFTDPRTGKRPYAIVQLRQDNKEGTLYNLVGFQTNLKFGEQKRVFSMLPGLKNAEFVKYGVMHRNTYIQSPNHLNAGYQLKKNPNIFFAGQITGVEGYEEAQAVQIVTDQGLIPDVEYSYSESAGVGYGQVYEMSPQGGQRIEQGSIITLRVLTEPEETDTQSDSTETSTETSEGSGTWATVSNLKIGQPDNYEGQMVRLRLVQGSEDAQGGTTILQDQVLTFAENGEYSVGQITGQSGESTGTLYFDVMDESGNYTTIWSYPLEFSEQ